MQEIVGCLGVPRQIYSDKVRGFESLLIHHLFQLLHIKKTCIPSQLKILLHGGQGKLNSEANAQCVGKQSPR